MAFDREGRRRGGGYKEMRRLDGEDLDVSPSLRYLETVLKNKLAEFNMYQYYQWFDLSLDQDSGKWRLTLTLEEKYPRQ